jgi:hypothetical protein
MPELALRMRDPAAVFTEYHQTLKAAKCFGPQSCENAPELDLLTGLTK